MTWTRLSHLHARGAPLILLATLAFAVFAAAFGAPVAGLLKDRNDFESPGSPSVRARAALTRATGVSPDVGLVAVITGRTPPGAVARVIATEPGVGRVQTSGNHVAAYFTAKVGAGDDELAERLEQDLKRFPDVVSGGRPLAGFELSKQVRHDLAHAELLAFPLLFALSLWLFRGLIAALLVPLVGALAILATLLALRAIDPLLGISVYALNLVTALGLGLAIDYSLLMITRYREELARSGPGREALEATLRSAGRTVLFSAITVAAALASLAAFPQRFLYSMGIGGAIVSAVAALAAIVVLPAALALLNTRIGRPGRTPRAWPGIAQAVTRRPAVSLIAALAILGTLMVPAAGIRFTGVDGHALPRGTDARQAADLLERAGAGAPGYVVTDGARPTELAAKLHRDPGLTEVSPPRRAGHEWWIDFAARGAPFGATARAAVERIPAGLVGGQTAAFLDQQRSLAARLPLGLLAIAVITIAVLIHMTRSLVLAAKAFVTNLLSAAAALGVLVLVFQHGHAWGATALDATQPVLLCALAFALSTDYGVFLLARVKEAHDRGLADPEAVREGLVATGRTITGAALLFCVAVGGLVTSRVVLIKELGLGVAAAVAIDASVVRMLLVPGAMCLLKGANWWLPHLRRQPQRRRPEAAQAVRDDV